MAVAYVSDVSGQDVTGVPTTLTLSSVNAGGGNFLLVFATFRDTSQAVTGITYNGNAMTRVTGFGFDGSVGSSGVGSDAFYALNPGGTANVVITWNSAPPRIYGTALVFSGVDQTTPFGTIQHEGGAAAATTDRTLTTVVDGMVADYLHIRADEGIAPDAGQTERSQENGTALDTHGASTEPASTTSTVVGWTWTTSAGFHHGAVPLRPAAGGGGTSRSVFTANDRRRRT